MTVPLDTVTVLTTKGPLATKRIIAVNNGPPKIEEYGLPRVRRGVLRPILRDS